MKQEKWQEIKDKIKDQFKIEDEATEPIELNVGLDQQQKIGEKEIIVFTSPIGKVKLEFSKKPVVLDKKENYSKRGGTSSRTKYILSTDEFVTRMEAFRWNEAQNDWEQIDSSAFE